MMIIPISEIIESFKRLAKGGEGSGNFGHEGRPGEVGGSGEGGGGGISSERSERARASYKPSTRHVQAIADKSEKELSKAVNGRRTSDNDAFDVIKGNNAIEVKTIVRGENPKITMHPESRARKLEFAQKNGMQMHTVVFHNPTNSVYYKSGVGSYRLKNMQKVSSLRALAGIIR